MLKHSWGGADPTWEQVELSLLREFGCLPSALHKEKWIDLAPIFLALKAESMARDANRK